MTANPTEWQFLGAATADALGEFHFVDPPPLPAQRFYRARLPVPAPTIRFESLPAPAIGKRPRIAFPGMANRTYRIESTDSLGTNPIQWQILGRTSADASGELQFVDPTSLPARRFYRASEE